MKGEHWGRAIAVSGPNRLRGWKALVAVWLTVLGLNVLIVLGFRGGTWDAVEFTAQFRFVADSVKQGELLQWTPLINGGCPAGFEPELGAASPLLLGVAWISNGSEFGFRLYWLTLWCLGGTGIFLLACHLGASPRLAYVAAVGYAFSAIYMSHAEHTSYLATMSLFPWALWRLDVGLVCRRWPAAAEAGAIWGLSALGGYPPLVGAGGAYLFAWSLGRLCFGGDPSPERLESHGIAMPQVAECFGKPGFVAAAAAVCAAVGLVVMSPTYLGFLAELRGYTDRGVAMPWQQVSTYGFMPPAAMTTFASPYLALWNSLSGRPLWQSDVTLASICVSPLLLVLALSMGGRAADKRFRCFLWLLAFGCLVLAFGGRTPIYGLLYDALPPLRFARLSSPFRLYYVLTVVVLAVMAGLHLERHAGQDGADDWRSHRARVAGSRHTRSGDFHRGRLCRRMVAKYRAVLALAGKRACRRDLDGGELAVAARSAWHVAGAATNCAPVVGGTGDRRRCLDAGALPENGLRKQLPAALETIGRRPRGLARSDGARPAAAAGLDGDQGSLVFWRQSVHEGSGAGQRICNGQSLPQALRC